MDEIKPLEFTREEARFEKIEIARDEVRRAEETYLRSFGWSLTCNTPGAYCLWRRDFAAEDAERLARWKARGPGPMGWPSEPRPYGVITADRELAVGMTVKALDLHPYSESDDNE